MLSLRHSVTEGKDNMIFFGKKTPLDTTEIPANTSPQTEETSIRPPRAPQTGTIRTQQRNHRILNEAQLHRTKEAKRLAETKLRNVEDSIKRLQTQQEKGRRYSELKIALETEKRHLYELTKQQSSVATEAEMLQRYEKFENIQGGFQRLKILEKLCAQNSQNQTTMERETEEQKQLWEKQTKELKQIREQKDLAEERFLQVLEPTFQANKLDGSTETTEAEIAQLMNLAEMEKQTLNSVDGNIRKHQEEVELLTEELERHRTGRQSMEMHESMLEHGEAILLRLEYLQETEENRKTLKNKLAEAEKNQNRENEMLGKFFSQYQDIVVEAEKLEDELHTHRTNIHGQNSYQLQERAMMLKNRKQMLLSAQSLWSRISTGYNVIEEKARQLNELRLHIEHTENNIRNLEKEYNHATYLCKEKEYTYLLSKGQNVIQLRAELKEGISCSVCGATHHPYHSDTMLDQSKLIGEFKTDYELLDAEAYNLRIQLEELRMDLAENRGKRHAEEAALQATRIRQEEDVREWQIFAQLDSSFPECSASTNLDARSAMIRQLIDNAERNSTLAQKELDTFNFHQSRITELSEKLQTLEQKKAELSLRLNEVNTGCQVMVGHVERIQAQLEAENAKYKQTYEGLEKSITLTEWLRQWNESHEALLGHIQQMMNAWEAVNDKIRTEQQELSVENAILKELEHTRQMVLLRQEAIEERIEKCRIRISENQKSKEQLWGTNTSKNPFLEAHEQLRQAKSNEAKVRDSAIQIRRKVDEMTGRNDFNAQTNLMLREELNAERSQLDLWIHNFNAHNPPVQYAELEKIFSEERDWNTIRQKVDDIQLQTALTQSRVNDLNSRFISLQAEGVQMGEIEEVAHRQLVEQQESLESKRRDIVLQLARLTLALEEHEKALSAACETEESI